MAALGAIRSDQKPAPKWGAGENALCSRLKRVDLLWLFAAWAFVDILNIYVRTRDVNTLTCVAALSLCQTACIPMAPAAADYEALQVPSSVEQEYHIQVGDKFAIKLFYNPELNEGVIVRADGRISLQPVQEVGALGLTPTGLMWLLAEKYSASRYPRAYARGTGDPNPKSNWSLS